MSLNTMLRSVGFGQPGSGTSSRGRRSSSPGARASILPAYYRAADQRLDGSSSPIQLSTGPRSSDPSKGNTTTEIHEIEFQDIATARFDYPYSTGEGRVDRYGSPVRLPARQTQDRYLHGGEGSDNGSQIEASLEFAKPATSAVLLRPFLANFTIGFADGLTVPFALTAGLSWLGSSHMVITAGFAEICAGCVSMGIGGYLAADSERKAEAREAAKEAAAAEEVARERQASISSLSNAASAAGGSGSPDGARADGDSADIDLVRKYLEPLHLPSHVAAAVYEHVTTAGGGTSTQTLLSTAATLGIKNRHDGSDETNEAQTSPAASTPVTMSPVMCGLSVSVGYLAGGLLPLFPYFFVDQVQHGLIWSFIVCVVALFTFGATKEFVMFVDEISEDKRDLGDYYSPAWDNLTRPRGAMFGTLRQWVSRARRVSRADIKSSLWDGWRMAWLGSIAAIVAVLCVMVSQFIMEGPEHSIETEPIPPELLDAIVASYGNGSFPVKP